MLVYIVSSPAPTPYHVLIKPPITQVYSWRGPTSTPSSLDPVQSDYLSIALYKGKR